MGDRSLRSDRTYTRAIEVIWIFHIKFSALLLESFFKDDAKHLTQDWLSRELKFMKEEEAEDRGYWPDPESYAHEPWPLQQFIEQHKKRKKRKTAA